jgi:hypothetical protein
MHTNSAPAPKPELSVDIRREGQCVTTTITGSPEGVQAEIDRLMIEYPPEGYGTNVSERSEDGTRAVVVRSTSCD